LHDDWVTAIWRRLTDRAGTAIFRPVTDPRKILPRKILLDLLLVICYHTKRYRPVPVIAIPAFQHPNVALVHFSRRLSVNFSFRDWIGEVTTGHGAMILGPTLMAAWSGTMSWTAAAPLLAAGVVGLLWPENTAMKSAAQTAATDVETLIEAYRTGLGHGAAGDTPSAVTTASAPPAPSGAAMSALAMLAATGLALTACAGQTPAQQTATATTVASGLLCVADATGQIVTTATTSDPNAIKGVDAAISAGSVLMTDAACQSALSGAVTAIQAPSAAAP
jgi:hypothetical protein